MYSYLSLLANNIKSCNSKQSKMYNKIRKSSIFICMVTKFKVAR